MPWSAFSRAPSRIFYPILFYKFCVLAGLFSGLCYGWRRLEFIVGGGEGNKSEDCGRNEEMNPDGLTKKI